MSDSSKIVLPEPSVQSYAADELLSAQAFLHGELDDSSADEIRSHLMACESCMDNYEIEQMITTMIRRCCHAEHASSGLRARISRLSITINGPTP